MRPHSEKDRQTNTPTNRARVSHIDKECFQSSFHRGSAGELSSANLASKSGTSYQTFHALRCSYMTLNLKLLCRYTCTQNSMVLGISVQTLIIRKNIASEQKKRHLENETHKTKRQTNKHTDKQTHERPEFLCFPENRTLAKALQANFRLLL